MTLDELINLIKAGESDTVELKESFGDAVIDAVGMFANTHGGIVIVGVSDEGEVRGVTVEKETLTQWSNDIAQATDPRIVIDIEAHEVEGKTVVVIEAPESPLKPVSAKGRYFKRVAKGKQRMSQHEIAHMHLHSVGQSWDKLPSDASLADIDHDLVRQFSYKASEVRRRKVGADEAPQQVLEKLELIKDGRPTWAALLLFQKYPQRHLPQAAVHCGRFKGVTVLIDDDVVEGSILDQIAVAMDFVRKNINVRFVITGTPAREEVWDYPLNALREAIINAICHRDYTIPSHVEVRIYDDELVIWSPGRLPVGVTVEDLYKEHHASVLRNTGISEVFYDVGLIEKWGRGTSEMRRACREAGLPEPRFEEYQHGFQVVFRQDIYSEEYLRTLGLSKRQINAVIYVKERGKITNKEYQEANHVSRQTATNDLTELVNKKLFVRIGKAGKGIAYQLTKLPIN